MSGCACRGWWPAFAALHAALLFTLLLSPHWVAAPPPHTQIKLDEHTIFTGDLRAFGPAFYQTASSSSLRSWGLAAGDDYPAANLRGCAIGLILALVASMLVLCISFFVSASNRLILASRALVSLSVLATWVAVLVFFGGGADLRHRCGYSAGPFMLGMCKYRWTSYLSIAVASGGILLVCASFSLLRTSRRRVEPLRLVNVISRRRVSTVSIC
eukprot:m.95789 g.95789  ORF g.95789 m.95789 type:complete len:214 (+) comp51302_c0_seq1:236-877(+)